MNGPDSKQPEWINRLLASRYLNFGFWSLIALVLAAVLFGMLETVGISQGIEYAMLDARQIERAKYYTPSKDIVVVALDRRSDLYVRQNPEIGFHSVSPFPRDQLAKVVNWLNKQGVRAIIYDLEFKDQKPVDTQLAAAMAGTPYRYSAGRMDSDFRKMQEEALSHFQEDGFYEKGKHIAWQIYEPYIRYEVTIRRHLYGRPYVGALELGFLPTHPLFYTPNVQEYVKAANFRALAEKVPHWNAVSVLPGPPHYRFRYIATLPSADGPVEGTGLRIQKLLAHKLYYEPYIRHEVTARRLLYGRSYVGEVELGLAPLDAPPFYNDEIRQLLETTNRQDLLQRGQPLTSLSVPPAQPELPFPDTAVSFLYRYCTEAKYMEDNSPAFLHQLALKKVPMSLTSPLPADLNTDITRCYTGPTSMTLMPILTGMGVPTVNYDKVGYIRWIPVFHRGYEGNFYFYLGVRPAIDLAGANHLEYDPSGSLQFGERRIPLLEVDGQQYLPINWRDPKRLAEEMLEDAGFIEKKDRTSLGILKENWNKPARFWNELFNKPQNFYEARLDETSSTKNNELLAGGNSYRTVSIIHLWRLAQGETLPPDEAGVLYNVPFEKRSGEFSFKDKIVIIGDTMTDIHRVPVGNTFHGPEVVATVLDMMLHDKQFVQKAPLEWQWAIIALLTLAIATIVVRFESHATGFTLALTLIVFYWFFNYLVFIFAGYWFDFFVPSLVLAMMTGLAMIYRFFIHDREKRQLTHVFSRYVSPQIMDEITRNPEQALDNLRGGKKELTVLFSDLHGFTSSFENADPELMVEQLNEYFDAMTEAILKYDGTYDKYMGDAIMAFFGAPADLPNHAELACRAAVEMQRALIELNDKWRVEGKRPLSHGIGLSTGEMFVGNFGSRRIKNFTVMGSNVNLGSRLETYSRVANWPIIISERTYELAKDQIKVRNLGQIRVKGFSEAVQSYGLEGVRRLDSQNTVDTVRPVNEPEEATEETEAKGA